MESPVSDRLKEMEAQYTSMNHRAKELVASIKRLRREAVLLKEKAMYAQKVQRSPWLLLATVAFFGGLGGMIVALLWAV